MNKQLRWSQITELCKQKEIVSVTEIADALLISPATVRRDLQEMEDLGMIIRTHGGAKITGDQTEEPSMILKAESNSSEKKQIAYAAAKLIKDNQMVYLDAGSTTYAMIEYITAKNITVVTPGIPHVELLGKKGISTIMLGGIVRWSTQAITGKQATKQLNDYYLMSALLEQTAFMNRLVLQQAMKWKQIRRLWQFIIQNKLIFWQMNPNSIVYVLFNLPN